jgi:hypothetical protein
MGFSAPKRSSAAWLGGSFAALSSVLALACSSGSPPPPPPSSEQALAPLRCSEDQAREFQCEAFLPLGTTLAAPAPFEQCPVAMDIGFSAYTTSSTLARFDPGYTQYIRRRSSPGHNCCYSWCSDVEIAEPSEVDGQLCRSPLAFVESYCLTEFEADSSGAMSAPPLDRCPAAIVPPAATSFSVPKAAGLDLRMTGARRAQQRPECCYSWCSLAPPGTGLERKR